MVNIQNSRTSRCSGRVSPLTGCWSCVESSHDLWLLWKHCILSLDIALDTRFQLRYRTDDPVWVCRCSKSISGPYEWNSGFFWCIFVACCIPNIYSLPKEPLNKSPTADDGSFPPILRFEKREIHTVFPRFSNLVLTKNLSPSTAADLIRASLIPCFFIRFFILLPFSKPVCPDITVSLKYGVELWACKKAET